MKARELLDEAIEQRLGTSAKPEDFDGDDDVELVNPDLYEDEDQKEAQAPDRDDIPGDDAYDNYMGPSSHCRKETKSPMPESKEEQKFEEIGSAIGRAHNNPIIDTPLNRPDPDSCSTSLMYSGFRFTSSPKHERIMTNLSIDSND